MADAADRKPLKIYQDEVKLRHTSHWDADFMGRAEFEAYMDNIPRDDPDRGDTADTGGTPAQRQGGRADGRGKQSWWERFMQRCTGQ